VNLVTEEFWNRARQLTLDHGAALIADEIQCGLGRTGRKFGFQKFSAVPDIVTVAKPLAGGLPLGAFIANNEFASAFSPGLHGSTFGGGPLVCAAALEFLTIVEEEGLLDNVRARGAELHTGLEVLARRFDFIREIRGEGLIIGIDLSIDGTPFVAEALRQGLLINCTHDHILRLLPPFVIKQRDVAEFLHTFESVLTRVSKAAAKSAAASAAVKSESTSQPLALVAAR
jgi:acetylornithine/succinyldiaminopimelate/putrescine aminotransferase